MPPERVKRIRPAALLHALDASPRPQARERMSRLRDEALALIEAEDLLDPAYAYRIVPIEEVRGGELVATGRTLGATQLLPESGRLTAVACCVATLGDRLERRVRDLFSERRASLAVALDQLANEILFALSRLAQDDMLKAATREDLCMAGELRSGDPGLALTSQETVLFLAGGADIGVSLSAGLVMHPLKSTSMVMGVGIDLPPARWSRCDPCPSRPRCKIAARAEAAAAP
jgi:hypothetical protein